MVYIKISLNNLTGLAFMFIISFSNLFGFNIAGMTVFVGILFFFCDKIIEKEPFSLSCIDPKYVGEILSDKSLWTWIFLPIIMNIVAIFTAEFFLPEYIDHILGRTSIFISFDKIIFLLLQIFILALLEEIAWRGFFQKQLYKKLTLNHVLIISSFLFSICHFTSGNMIVISYDLTFIFINSIIYGYLFFKTRNVWVSTLSHFMANLFSVFILALL